MYFDIPASLPGTVGVNYNETAYEYDDSGHRWRVKQPDGTISRTVFDTIGRVIESWIGTNDYGFEDGEGSGPSDMVQLLGNVYDTGNDNGPSLVTQQTRYVQDNTTDERVTTFEYDNDNRLIVQNNPQPPHQVNQYDHMGRMTATALYSDDSGLDENTDPISEDTDRMALSETFYDEMGQVYKTTRHKIDPTSGSDDAEIDTLTWYDAAGRVIKEEGEGLSKTGYDRIGRTIHEYELAIDNDSTYADADDVTGDIVLEQHSTIYDPDDGNVIASYSIARHYNDYGGGETTGTLDTNADTDNLLLTAANLKGRVQISVNWYDRLDRVIDTVMYGNNGGSNFDLDGSSPTGTFDLATPSRSATALRTTYLYNDEGEVATVTDPNDIDAVTVYDDAGRTITTIANYVNGSPSSATADDDVITRFVYDDGHRTKLFVDIDGDNVEDVTDQITTYAYGVTKGGSAGDSKISHNGLLHTVAYPDSSGGSDLVTYAYNAQQQPIWTKDQIGYIIETNYDPAGKITHRRATNTGSASGLDETVKRISYTYDGLGRNLLISQYDNATPGSGTLLNEVRNTYEGWGMLSAFELDRNSAVDAGGSVDDYQVSYTYSTTAGALAKVYRTAIELPSGADITLGYSSSGSLHDYDVGRVTTVTWTPMNNGTPGTPVEASRYFYNGVSDVVGVSYNQPDVYSSYYSHSSHGTFPDLDRFNRPIGSSWTKRLSPAKDFVRFLISYDQNSNITAVEDSILGAGAGFDVKYTMDNLNRLLEAEEGNYSTGSISSPKRIQTWKHSSVSTLDQLGNWTRVKLNLNVDVDSDYADTNEYDDTRTHNLANELLTRDLDSTSGTTGDNYSMSHDANGNMIDDGKDYEYVFDVFGRLMTLKKTSNQAIVAEYTYYGNNFRASEKYDSDADLDVDGNDKTYFFAYNENWQIVSTFRESDATAKEEFVYHAAGHTGFGGSSYIDDVVLRDRDVNTAWTTASDATRESRRYYCQNCAMTWYSSWMPMVSRSNAIVTVPTVFLLGCTRVMWTPMASSTARQVPTTDRFRRGSVERYMTSAEIWILMATWMQATSPGPPAMTAETWGGVSCHILPMAIGGDMRDMKEISRMRR